MRAFDDRLIGEGQGTSSPTRRGLPALASQGAQRPRRLGRKGEGYLAAHPSPFFPKLACGLPKKEALSHKGRGDPQLVRVKNGNRKT